MPNGSAGRSSDRVPAKESENLQSNRHHFRRYEVKFEMGHGSAAFLRREIAARLPVFEFRPGFPYTYITTIYFDTGDRELYERARRHYDDNEKLRAKEYCYRESSGEFITSPLCFLELKRRDDGIVTKHRLALPKALLGRFLAGEDISSEIFEHPSEGNGGDGAEKRTVYDLLRSYIDRYDIRATSAIVYRRQVFQVDEDELRVTFDDEIAVYQPPPSLYDKRKALTAGSLGVPIRRFSQAITEIKCSGGETPEWLQRALRNHSSKRLSKFTTSVGSIVQEGLSSQRNANRDSQSSENMARAKSGRDPLEDTQVTIKPIES